MSSTHYKIVLSLSVAHNYFVNGVCPSLRFSIAPEQKSFMHQYGFRLVPKQGGFDLAVNSLQPLEKYIDYLRLKTAFSSFLFEVHVSDPVFYQYTEMPLNQLMGFSYTSADVMADSTSESSVELKPNLVETSMNNVLASIAIQWSDVIAAGASIPVYTIRYQSRKTQWRYYVVSANTSEAEKMIIEDKEGHRFQNSGTTTLANGRTAVCFISVNDDMALSEKPKYKFNLLKDTNETSAGSAKRSAQIIFKSLPNPDPGNLVVKHENGNQLAVSPVYVYI